MTQSTEASRISRRKFVSAVGLGAAATMAGAAIDAGVAQAAPASGVRQRVVVIGGGIAGIATAWLLDGEHDVTVLEATPSLGGHAISKPVYTASGKKVLVDAGAQFFGSHSHPIYNTLVTSVLNIPTVPIQLDNTVIQYGVQTPIMVTPSVDRPITDVLPYLPKLQAVAELMQRARDLETSRDWSTTVAGLVESMSPEQDIKDNLLYPYVASVNGATISQGKELSARAALALAVRPLVGNGEAQTTDYVNARDGLQSVVLALAAELTDVTTLVGTGAVGLFRQQGVWRVTDTRGQIHLADQVVLALPPEAALTLVRQLPQSDQLRRTYERFSYTPGRIAIHADPTYMPTSRSDWSSFNIMRDGDFCEASISYELLRGDVNVFKSWALHRREEPKQLLASKDYRHPLITPNFISGQTDLQNCNGSDGLWFAGSHVFDVDSQESALYSALVISETLAPHAVNRTRLGTLPATPVAP